MGKDDFQQEELGSPVQFDVSPPPNNQQQQHKCVGVSQFGSLAGFLTTGCLGLCLLVVSIVIFNGVMASVSSPDFNFGLEAPTREVSVGKTYTEQGTTTPPLPTYFKVLGLLPDNPRQTIFRACVTGDVTANIRFAQPPAETPTPVTQGPRRNIDVLESTYQLPTCASGDKAEIPVCYGNYSVWVRVSSQSVSPFTVEYSIKNCVPFFDTCFTDPQVCDTVMAINFFAVLIGVALVTFLFVSVLCTVGLCCSCCSCCFGCCFTVLLFRNSGTQQPQNQGFGALPLDDEL